MQRLEMVETLTCSRTFSVRLEMLDNEFCHRLKNQDISRKSTGKYPVYDATFYAYVTVKRSQRASSNNGKAQPCVT